MFKPINIILSVLWPLSALAGPPGTCSVKVCEEATNSARMYCAVDTAAAVGKHVAEYSRDQVKGLKKELEEAERGLERARAAEGMGDRHGQVFDHAEKLSQVLAIAARQCSYHSFLIPAMCEGCKSASNEEYNRKAEELRLRSAGAKSLASSSYKIFEESVTDEFRRQREAAPVAGADAPGDCDGWAECVVRHGRPSDNVRDYRDAEPAE